MDQKISFRFSDDYRDSANIHDELYTYNLSKTKAKRIEVYADKYPEQFALLACDETGTSYGGISFHWLNEPRHIFVDFFYLKDELRGKGIGKELFSVLISYAKENGAEKIDLTTNTFQAPGFYQKIGFSITGKEKQPFPGCPENIHYHLTLNLI